MSMTLGEIHRRFSAGELTPAEAAEATLKLRPRHDPRVRQALTFGALIAAIMALGWVLGCGHGNYLPPMPPLPGPNVNDWAKAPDGGGQ